MTSSFKDFYNTSITYTQLKSHEEKKNIWLKVVKNDFNPYFTLINLVKYVNY